MSEARTAVPLDRLRALNDGLLALPEQFTVHRKLERMRAKRREIFEKPDERGIDWTTAEDHQNMLQQLGITKLRQGPSGSVPETDPRSANYDEAKANPFVRAA